MTADILVFGHGPVGRATVERLAVQGRAVRVAQRSRPQDLAAGTTFQSCDVLDGAAVRRAVQGASQLVVAIGFAYRRPVWRANWPLAMRNLLDACEAAQARMIFVDNLYMYGPQTAPLREDMALTESGGKPGVRAQITRQWMQAAGRVRVAALRAPDFYGPGTGQSHLGDLAFGELASGKSAKLIVPPDMPHDFAYVPDIARAVESLLDAPDDAYGQAWHMPCAPIRTSREILEIGARALGEKLRITALPLWAVGAMGAFSPMMREMAEMRFLWDRPYHVDAGKFARRFWSDVTPFEVGAAATAHAFRAAAGG